MKVMTAIESCRTAALGGHVARCEDCAHTVISYDSHRKIDTLKSAGGAAARTWMDGGEPSPWRCPTSTSLSPYSPQLALPTADHLGGMPPPTIAVRPSLRNA